MFFLVQNKKNIAWMYKDKEEEKVYVWGFVHMKRLETKLVVG
jgi:hypothetical protein